MELCSYELRHHLLTGFIGFGFVMGTWVHKIPKKSLFNVPTFPALYYSEASATFTPIAQPAAAKGAAGRHHRWQQHRRTSRWIQPRRESVLWPSGLNPSKPSTNEREEKSSQMSVCVNMRRIPNIPHTHCPPNSHPSLLAIVANNQPRPFCDKSVCAVVLCPILPNVPHCCVISYEIVCYGILWIKNLHKFETNWLGKFVYCTTIRM